MALSRWSHSAFYIYESSDGELQICLFGHYTLKEINEEYCKIEQKAKEQECTFLERLELRAYLKLWAKFMDGKIEFPKYIKILNWLRAYGFVKSYVESPYRYKDFAKKLLFYFPFFYYGLRISEKERKANRRLYSIKGID